MNEDRKLVHERLLNIQVEAALKSSIYDDLVNNRLTLAEGKECPLCLKRVDSTKIGVMRIKNGPYGEFLSCSMYPVCKFTWNTPLDVK